MVLALCSLGPLWLTSAAAQEPPLWPGAKYDPAIPTIKQVLGHDHGEVIEIRPPPLVLFPAGWTGECHVQQTLRNVYMLAED